MRTLRAGGGVGARAYGAPRVRVPRLGSRWRPRGWDEARCRKVVTRAVMRKIHLFAPFRDLGNDPDFLIDECLDAARIAFRKCFDPSKSSWCSFVYCVTARRLIDRWRSRSRQAEREAFVAVRDWCEAAAQDDTRDNLPGSEGGDRLYGADETIEEWSRRVYLFARRAFRGRRTRGRKSRALGGFNFAQVIAVALLMSRLALSCRGAVLFLAARPAVFASIDLPRMPSREFFRRAAEVVSDNFDVPAPAASPRAAEKP